MIDLDSLDFGKAGGTVTVVTQDARTGQVLMVAHADREALERTVRTGEMHYRSRSRGLWRKGETSGNVQKVLELLKDCDSDAIVALIEPLGPACHTGERSCFTRHVKEGGATSGEISDSPESSLAASLSGGASAAPGPVVSPNDRPADPLTALDRTIEARLGGAAGPESYTRRLAGDRNLRLKKLGEEAAEFAIACADGDRDRAVAECADLFYHAMVALRAVGGTLDHVRAELLRRAVGRTRDGGAGWQREG